MNQARLCLVSTVLFLICVVAASAQQPATNSPPADIVYAQPGQLVDAGGFRLNFYCMGSGSPAVIFESAFADWSPAWAVVLPRIAAWTRARVYDHAGAGFSDPGPMPRNQRSHRERTASSIAQRRNWGTIHRRGERLRGSPCPQLRAIA
jgi:pimeloyl-ACP methyl ester carboxylesterase